MPEVTRDEAEPLLGAWSKTDWAVAAVVCGVAVLLPALVSIAAGSFSLPQNDDWSYRRTAEQFALNGHLDFNGWTSMTLIGQILWSWPFLRILGERGWVFGFSTALLSAVGVACAYYVARQVLARWRAAAAVLLVAAIPGFAWSTSTFMTDAPAFAAEMVCLAFGMAAVGRSGRSRVALIGAAMTVGVFGFSIREFAVAAPIAVLFSVGASSRHRQYGYLAAGLVELAVCAVVYRWATHVPGYFGEALSWPGRRSVESASRAYFTLALFLSPAVFAAAWRRYQRRDSWATAAGLVVFLAGGTVALDHGLFTGNYLSQQGFAGSIILSGERPTVVPGALWGLLTLLALVAGAVLASIGLTLDGRVVRHWRPGLWGNPLGLVWAFTAVVGTGLGIYALAATGVFDRYLWALAFAVGVLLLWDRQRRPGGTADRSSPRYFIGVGLALSALLVVVSGALTVNADTYAAARWHAGEAIVAQGVPASEVDAGFEWVGWHARRIANQAVDTTPPAYESWYARMEPGFRDCGVVSGSPLDYPALRLLQKTSYELLGFGSRRSLYLYISSMTGC